MEEITSTVNKLGNLAEKLKERLDIFRLEEATRKVRKSIKEVETLREEKYEYIINNFFFLDHY